MSEKVVGVDMGTGPSWAVRVTMEDGKVIGIKRRRELIQWPMAKYWDEPWNPVIGCEPVSPACDNCYARAAMVDRFGQSFEPHPSKKQTPPKKGVVFCGNLTDLFGDWVNAEDSIGFIRKTLECRDATFLYLTKRPANMMYDLREGWLFREFGGPGEDRLPELFSNHYFGFTAENQEWYEKRCADYCNGYPKIFNGWISAEPLLGPIDFDFPGMTPNPFKWVVVGAESGPNRRPCGLGWVESIVAQCQRAKVPVFVKQICLQDGRFTNKIEEFPPHLRIRQVPWAKEEA